MRTARATQANLLSDSCPVATECLSNENSQGQANFSGDHRRATIAVYTVALPQVLQTSIAALVIHHAFKALH